MHSKSNRNYAIAIGTGLAIYPIHNRWLTDITSVEGMATMFLPAIGMVIWILATLFFLRDNWKVIGWGDKKVFISLLVIVGAIGLSGITADTLGKMVSPLLMGGSMLALYLVARVLGKDIFLPLAIGAVIASIGVFLSIMISPIHLCEAPMGNLTGGLLFEYNYDIVVGYVLLGMALFIHRWQWLLASLSLVAMFLSGSPEGVFVIGVLAVVVLARRDWGKKLAMALTPLVIIVMICLTTGYAQNLYSYIGQIMNNEPVVIKVSELPEDMPTWTAPAGEGDEVVPEYNSPPGVLGHRLWLITEAMADIKPFGTGYEITVFDSRTVHNVPLVIVQQLGYPGILAALAWLYVTIYCLVRTRYKYVFVLILALSVWDHFVWTQIGVWWTAIIGVATGDKNIKSDKVFND